MNDALPLFGFLRGHTHIVISIIIGDAKEAAIGETFTRARHTHTFLGEKMEYLENEARTNEI